MAQQTPTLPEEDRPDIDPDLGLAGGNSNQPSYGRPGYDPQNTPVGDPFDPRGDLRDAESGGSGDGLYNPAGDSSATSPDELKNAEESTDDDEDDDKFRDSHTAAALGMIGKGYVGHKLKKRRKVRITKRGGAVGGLIGILIGLIFGGFSIIQGPMQFVHIAQLLQRFHFSSLQDLNDSRLIKVARFIHDPSKLERTRLGVVGTAVADKLEDRMKANGIESSYKAYTRFGDGYTVDGDHEKYKDVQGNDEKFKAAVGKEYGVDTSHLEIYSENGRRFVRIKLKGMGPIAKLKLGHLVLKNTGLGTISSGLGSRIMGERAGVTWHPIKKLDQKILQAGVDAVADKAKQRAQQREDFNKSQADVIDRGAKLTIAGASDVPDDGTGNTDTEEKKLRAGEASSSVQNFMDHPVTRVAAGGTAVVGVACVAKGLSDSIGQLRTTQVILPMIRMGMQAISLGGQVMSGQDISLEQLGLFQEQLSKIENGKVTSTWNQAKSVQYELGETDTGKDIPNAAKVFNKANPFSFINAVPEIDTICKAAGSTIGQGVSLAFSGGPLSAGFSLAMGKVIEKTGVMETIAKWAAGDAVDPLAAGADRGNYMNYGARLAANDQAVAAGGTELSDSQEAGVKSASAALDKADFESHNIAYRLLNTTDSRSLISRVVDQQNPNVTQNIDQMASGFTGVFSSALKAPGTLLSGVVHAAPAKYDYGFAKYGFSMSDQESSQVQNPFKNANKAADLLDADTDGKLQQKITDCFGVEVSNSDGAWGVTSGGKSITDLYDTDTYDKHDCNEGTEEWRTIRFFILDTETIEAYDCYEGNTSTSDQSCADVGFGGSQESSDSPDSDGPVASGSAQELAQKILDYRSSGKYKCDNTGDCTDLQKVAKGQSIAGSSGCTAKSLDPKVLKLILYVIETGHFKVGTYALCGDHRDDGPHGHSGGFAVDISSVNGKAINRPDSRSQALALAKFLNKLNGELRPRQLITDGYGNKHDSAFTALEINGNTTGSAAAAAFAADNPGHRDHIHAGY